MRIYQLAIILFLAVPTLSAETWQDPEKEVRTVRFIRCWNLTQEEDAPHPSFRLCDTVFENEPAWNPIVAPEPPLAISDAVDITRGEIHRYDQPELEWRAHEIILREIGPDRWLYLVRWNAFEPQGRGSHNLLIPVLMSGQTIKGEILKTDDRRAR